MIAPFLAIAPATISWSPKVALVMIVANVIAIAIGKATIKQPNVGAPCPTPPCSAASATLRCSPPPAWVTSWALAPFRAWLPAACSELLPLNCCQLIQGIFSSARNIALAFFGISLAPTQ